MKCPKCPNCGHEGMRVNREMCLDCGVVFRDMAATYKDQLVRLLAICQNAKRENMPTRLMALALEQALGGKIRDTAGLNDIIRDFNALQWMEVKQ